MKPNGNYFFRNLKNREMKQLKNSNERKKGVRTREDDFSAERVPVAEPERLLRPRRVHRHGRRIRVQVGRIGCVGGAEYRMGSSWEWLSIGEHQMGPDVLPN